MNFPRLCALSEVMWSPKAGRDYQDFLTRLPAHERRLDECGVNYWRDKSVKIGEWKPYQIARTNLLAWQIPPSAINPGKCRLSLNYTQGRAGLKISWAALLENGHEILRDAHTGFTGAKPRDAQKARDWNYYLDLPAAKPGAKYTVEAAVTGVGGTDSSGVVFLDSVQ
jgi:hexosaminidase